MTVAFLITSSALLLEHEDLIILQVLKNLTFYRGAFYNRCTYLNLTAVLYEQDLVEAHRRIYFACKTVNIELSTLFSLELLTCNLYNYKHLYYKFKLFCRMFTQFSPQMYNFFLELQSLRTLFFRNFRFGIFLEEQHSANSVQKRMTKLLIYSSSSRCRALLGGLLRHDTVSVATAASREEFFGRCSEELFDRVVTDDVRMFMNGCNAVERIRQAQHGRMEIIVISNDLSEETILSLLECGVNQYISLPTTLARLKHKLCGVW